MKPLLMSYLCALLAFAAAQPATSFPDVPEDHWAGEAVARIAELGIIIGFPDQTFRGNEVLTRYQAALIVDRLLRVLEERPELAAAVGAEEVAGLRALVDDLGDVVGDLAARLAVVEARLEERPDADLTALRDQVAALTAEVVRLRSAVARLEAGGAVGPAGAPGAPGPEGPSGAIGPAPAPADDPTMREVPDAIDAFGEVFPPADTPEPDLPADVSGPFAVVPGDPDPAVGAPRADDFYVGLAGVAEPGSVALRLVVGLPRVTERFGVRAQLDYGRQSPLRQGTIAVAAHAIYHLDLAWATPYAGVGGGWQFDPGDVPGADAGPFAGALLGAEVHLTRRLGLFAEGTLDYYFGEPGMAAAPENADRRPLHTTLGLGVLVRF